MPIELTAEEILSENLTMIASTEPTIKEAQVCLDSFINALETNPSMIAQLTKYWASLNTMQRIAAGGLFIAPTLLLGFIFTTGPVLAIGGATGISYAMGGAVLDEHHFYTEKQMSQAREGIAKLCALLNKLIFALDLIRSRFATSLAAFQAENKKLVGNVNQLNAKLEELNGQMELFVVTKKMLQEDMSKLEQTITELRLNNQANQSEIQKKEAELTKVTKQFEEKQVELKNMATEVQTVRSDLEGEVKKANKVSEILKETVATLANAVIDDKNQSTAFQQKIEQLLTTEKNEFTTLTAKMSETEKELAHVKNELSLRNEEYADLLKQQTAQMQRLENIIQQMEANQTTQSSAQLLASFGFMKNKQQQELLGVLPPMVAAV